MKYWMIISYCDTWVELGDIFWLEKAVSNYRNFLEWCSKASRVEHMLRFLRLDRCTLCSKMLPEFTSVALRACNKGCHRGRQIVIFNWLNRATAHQQKIEWKHLENAQLLILKENCREETRKVSGQIPEEPITGFLSLTGSGCRLCH